MSSRNVAHEGRVVALRDDYSDYMPQLAGRIDAHLRGARRDLQSAASLVVDLRSAHAEYSAITEEAVRQRLVRLFASGSESVVVDGRGYVLGRRERGRRVLEVRRDDEAAGKRAEPVSALGAPRLSGFGRLPGPLFPAPAVDLSRIEALLTRPAAGGLPAYTVMQVLGQLQTELFELRKAVDGLAKGEA